MQVQIIKHHLFLNGRYPAILFKDGQILIMLSIGYYWDKNKFLSMKSKLPGDVQVDGDMLFNADYSAQMKIK